MPVHTPAKRRKMAAKKAAAKRKALALKGTKSAPRIRDVKKKSKA